jgi:hypothetical protein
MLGLTLSSIIERLGIKVISDGMGNPDFILMSSSVKNNTRMVGQKSIRKNNAGFSEWFYEFKKTFLHPLFELIVQMTLPIAEDRMTIVQAEVYFREKVLKNIDAVLTVENINKYLLSE